MNKKAVVGAGILYIFLLISCSSIPTEFKSSCEKYNIYYYTKADCYVFVLKHNTYGYFIFENSGKYYLRAERSGSGDMLYYGNGYPSVDAALTAAIANDTGENINWNKMTKKRKVICE
jgi:hypothetical protein